MPMLRARNRSPLVKPPRVKWELGPGKKYAVFLSHYKNEAGMEARYLRDLLQKVLHEPCFLDSQDLSSLHQLFTHGLLWSDTLVLLATKDVLRRPYCLLELWCAQRAGAPIVVLEIAGRGFSWTEAELILDDIEGSVDSPKAVALIESTLRSLAEIIDVEPPTLKQFGKDIASALRVQERATRSETPTRDRAAPNQASPLQATFHPWATDSGIIAAVFDVVDLLVLSVGGAPSSRLGKRGQLSQQSTPRWLARLGSSKTGKSIMHSGLARGMSVRRMLSNMSNSSAGLSSEGVRLSLRDPEKALTTANSSDVRRHLFGSQEDSSRLSRREGSPAPRTGQVLSRPLCISCCRHEEEALDAALFLQAVSGTPAPQLRPGRPDPDPADPDTHPHPHQNSPPTTRPHCTCRPSSLCWEGIATSCQKTLATRSRVTRCCANTCRPGCWKASQHRGPCCCCRRTPLTPTR